MPSRVLGFFIGWIQRVKTLVIITKYNINNNNKQKDEEKNEASIITFNS